MMRVSSFIKSWDLMDEGFDQSRSCRIDLLGKGQTTLPCQQGGTEDQNEFYTSPLANICSPNLLSNYPLHEHL